MDLPNNNHTHKHLSSGRPPNPPNSLSFPNKLPSNPSETPLFQTSSPKASPHAINLTFTQKPLLPSKFSPPNPSNPSNPSKVHRYVSCDSNIHQKSSEPSQTSSNPPHKSGIFSGITTRSISRSFHSEIPPKNYSVLPSKVFNTPLYASKFPLHSTNRSTVPLTYSFFESPSHEEHLMASTMPNLDKIVPPSPVRTLSGIAKALKDQNPLSKPLSAQKVPSRTILSSKSLPSASHDPQGVQSSQSNQYPSNLGLTERSQEPSTSPESLESPESPEEHSEELLEGDLPAFVHDNVSGKDIHSKKKVKSKAKSKGKGKGGDKRGSKDKEKDKEKDKDDPNDAYSVKSILEQCIEVPNVEELKDHEYVDLNLRINMAFMEWKKDYPDLGIPDDIEEYDFTVRYVYYVRITQYIDIGLRVARYSVILAVAFVAVGFACSHFFEMDALSYILAQIKSIHRYKPLLREMASRADAFKKDKESSPEMRIVFLAVVNTAVFFAISYFFGNKNPEMIRQLQDAASGLITEGNTKGVFDIIKGFLPGILGGGLGGLGTAVAGMAGGGTGGNNGGSTGVANGTGGGSHVEVPSASGSNGGSSIPFDD